MLEELHRLDLEQAEALSKLYVRLGNELAMHTNCLNQVALLESKRDQVMIEVWPLQNEQTKEEALAAASKEIDGWKDSQVRVLLTLKSSVWNTSNALKKLHEKRNIVRAQAQEQEELTEV